MNITLLRQNIPKLLQRIKQHMKVFLWSKLLLEKFVKKKLNFPQKMKNFRFYFYLHF